MNERSSERLSASDLIERLAAAGYLADADAAQRVASARAGSTSTSWWLHAVVGIGAAIAAICFIGSLTIAGLIDFDEIGGLLVWGTLMTIAGVLVRRAAGAEPDTTPRIFLTQIAFFSSMTGKVMIAGAGGVAFDSTWGAAAAAFGVTALTYPFGRGSFERFASCAASAAILLAAILVEYPDDVARLPLVEAFTLGALACAGWVFTGRRVPRALEPIGHAAIAAVAMVVVGIVALDHWRLSDDLVDVASVGTIAAMLAVSLAALVVWAAGGRSALRREPIALAVAGSALLGAISAPGVIAGLALLVLGHARGDRAALGAGAALLASFLWFYYYTLELSLAWKSAALVASGLALLAARGYLRWRRLDGSENP